jgi:hypothetical protein
LRTALGAVVGAAVAGAFVAAATVGAGAVVGAAIGAVVGAGGAVGATAGCAGAQPATSNTTTKSTPKILDLDPCTISILLSLNYSIGCLRQNVAVLKRRMPLPPFCSIEQARTLCTLCRVAESVKIHFLVRGAFRDARFNCKKKTDGGSSRDDNLFTHLL